jgi:hypothetical protein
MIFLLPILSIPLAVLTCWFLNFSADLGSRSSEQVRLDTYTLAICHQRKNFILEHIEATNRRIQKIQEEMDAIALACASGGELVPGFCQTADVILQGLSLTGKGLELYQNTERGKYLLELAGLKTRLAAENKLRFSDGILADLSEENISLFEDGFSRELTSSKRLTWENMFMTTWPQQLERNKFFSTVHRFRFEFYPKRQIAGVSPENFDDWQGIRTFEHQVKDSGYSRSHSACRIDVSPYQVRRLLQ